MHPLLITLIKITKSIIKVTGRPTYQGRDPSDPSAAAAGAILGVTLGANLSRSSNIVGIPVAAIGDGEAGMVGAGDAMS